MSSVFVVILDQFQSLFYWNGLLRCHLHHAGAHEHLVSILVLLEWSSEESHTQYTCACTKNVSILVLLEWSSEAGKSPPGYHLKILSFNPCSIGMVF